jgi:ABC-2 type transport system permease protein
MGHAWRIYVRLAGARVRSEMQYRFSFMAQLAGQFLITVLDFLALVILLNRFQRIGTWTLPEVALLYGTSAIAFSLAELFMGDFDDFDRLVIRGEFDRVLLRPVGAALQVAGSGFRMRRAGRLLQGIIALAVALVLLQPAWGLDRWAFLAITVLGGALIFAAILIAGASTAFWTPQTGEVINVFTYGGQFMASYPMSIYQEWLRGFFTIVVPIAFVNYYPALYLLQKPDPFGLPAWLPFAAPVVAVLAFSAAVAFWRVGVRHYQSTGS